MNTEGKPGRELLGGTPELPKMHPERLKELLPILDRINEAPITAKMLRSWMDRTESQRPGETLSSRMPDSGWTPAEVEKRWQALLPGYARFHKEYPKDVGEYVGGHYKALNGINPDGTPMLSDKNADWALGKAMQIFGYRAGLMIDQVEAAQKGGFTKDFLSVVREDYDSQAERYPEGPHELVEATRLRWLQVQLNADQSSPESKEVIARLRDFLDTHRDKTPDEFAALLDKLSSDDWTVDISKEAAESIEGEKHLLKFAWSDSGFGGDEVVIDRFKGSGGVFGHLGGDSDASKDFTAQLAGEFSRNGSSLWDLQEFAKTLPDAKGMIGSALIARIEHTPEGETLVWEGTGDCGVVLIRGGDVERLNTGHLVEKPDGAIWVGNYLSAQGTTFDMEQGSVQLKPGDRVVLATGLALGKLYDSWGDIFTNPSRLDAPVLAREITEGAGGAVVLDVAPLLEEIPPVVASGEVGAVTNQKDLQPKKGWFGKRRDRQRTALLDSGTADKSGEPSSPDVDSQLAAAKARQQRLMEEMLRSRGLL